MAGQNGAIRKTADGGVTWTLETSNAGAGILNDISLWDSSNLWAVGDGGVVVHTTDGGATWTAQSSGTTNTLIEVTASSASNAWMAGDGGLIKTTANGGTAWTSQTSGTTANFYAIRAADAKTVVAAGQGGVIVQTNDGGVSWTTKTSATTGDITMVSASGAGSFLTSVTSGHVERQTATPLPDYVGGTTDWTNGANMFGACLRAVSGAGVQPVWPVNATCPTTSGTYWSPIPINDAAAGAKIANTATAGSNSMVADLRFGMRTSATQPVGTYVADLTFEVIAPDAP